MGRTLPATAFALLLAAFTISCGKKIESPNKEPGPVRGETVTINNIEPRRDVTGNIIDAHGGCLQFFNGRFYLYGTAYGTNHDSLALNCPFRVYSSPDLGNWTFEGELLKEPPNGIYTRPSVVFNPNTRKYVLWYNWFSKLWDGQAGVAVSDSPVGPFKIVNLNAHLAGVCPGDGSLFVDDDGTSYYIYTAMGEGYAVRVERLTPDFLDSTGKTSNILARGGEAPVIFRRNTIYYALCGPLCPDCPYGSEVEVFTSSSPLGPFTMKPSSNINHRPDAGGITNLPTGNTMSNRPGNGIPMESTQGVALQIHPEHSAPTVPAQQTWVAKIPTAGEPVFIWMGDRWGSAPDGVKGHDFQYWSAPLKFSPDGDILPLEYIERWYIAKTRGD